jgi:hypothetical protein
MRSCPPCLRYMPADFGKPRNPARLEMATIWPDPRSTMCGSHGVGLRLTRTKQVCLDDLSNSLRHVRSSTLVVAADAGVRDQEVYPSKFAPYLILPPPAKADFVGHVDSECPYTRVELPTAVGEHFEQSLFSGRRAQVSRRARPSPKPGPRRCRSTPRSGIRSYRSSSFRLNLAQNFQVTKANHMRPRNNAGDNVE